MAFAAKREVDERPPRRGAEEKELDAAMKD
jgi:hypothetical protein